jgi:hypothetical protein
MKTKYYVAAAGSHNFTSTTSRPAAMSIARRCIRDGYPNATVSRMVPGGSMETLKTYTA